MRWILRAGGRSSGGDRATSASVSMAESPWWAVRLAGMAMGCDTLPGAALKDEPNGAAEEGADAAGRDEAAVAVEAGAL